MRDARILTFLGQPPALVHFELLLVPFALHRDITFGLCIVDYHRLVEELEALDLLQGQRSRFFAVIDYECLTLRLEVLLRDDFEDSSKLGEDFFERYLQLVDLDALFEISDLRAMVRNCERAFLRFTPYVKAIMQVSRVSKAAHNRRLRCIWRVTAGRWSRHGWSMRVLEVVVGALESYCRDALGPDKILNAAGRVRR